MPEPSSTATRLTEPLGFSVSSLDRSATKRQDGGWIAAQRSDPRAALVEIAGDKVALAHGHPSVRRPREDDDAIYLGCESNGRPWFAARAASPDESWRDLRSIAVEGLVPAEEIGLLAQARSLINWHMTHGFCANCGTATKMADGGYRRTCATCSSEHFPRTDPVVIMIVRSRHGLLLGRQSTWLPGMYSALAGFMEPGETIENAARREIFEEASIRVGEVRYVASQPWPFPSSLMIGLIGEALSETITIDPSELEQARWFGRDELLTMRDERHPDGYRFPTRMAIAHHLILTALQVP